MVVRVILILYLFHIVYSKDEINSQQQPYALSSNYLTHLARAEAQIYNEMVNYSIAVRKRLKLIKTYIHDYKDSTLKLYTSPGNAWDKSEQIASNPITAYRMIRRFSQDFKAIEDNLIQKLELKLEQKTHKILGSLQPPSKHELSEAIESILRIHYFYNLSLEDFTCGTIMGIKTQIGLTSPQSFQISKYASSHKYYSLAMDWLRITVEKNKKENSSFPIFELANVYKNTIEKHDMDWEENMGLRQLYIFSEKLSENPKAPTIRQVKLKKYKKLYNLDDPDVNYYNYLALCNGQKSRNEKASLSCWFDKRHEYFYLVPLKAELLNDEPLLIQFHEILSDKWSAEFKEVAIPHLNRIKKKKNEMDRTGTYAYLEDGAVQNSISRRIELITGLNVREKDASEMLQVVSYVFGAHVDLHLDTYGQTQVENDPYLKAKGDRIATFLVYLNDIERGGFTAFPNLQIYVKPEKGSAIFWYTSMKNGQSDRRMRHGACPVVLGHKWIVSKCMNSNRNFLTRRCDLKENI